MTRTDKSVAVAGEDQTVSPSGYRARIGDTEVLFASEAEFRKAERAMQALSERAARIPKIPSHYTDRKTPEAKALTEQAKAELDIKPLDTAMGLRVAYVDALGAGLTAAETADAQARAEVQALITEVCAILA